MLSAWTTRVRDYAAMLESLDGRAKKIDWGRCSMKLKKKGYTTYKRCPITSKGPPKQKRSLDLGPTCEGP